jgi:hypothetical protein
MIYTNLACPSVRHFYFPRRARVKSVEQIESRVDCEARVIGAREFGQHNRAKVQDEKYEERERE